MRISSDNKNQASVLKIREMESFPLGPNSEKV